MKTSGRFLIHGGVTCLMFAVVLLISSETTIGFQATTLTTPQQQRADAFPGSRGTISQSRRQSRCPYPYKYHPLLYAKPTSGNSNNNDPNKDTSNKKKPKAVVKDAKSNPSPLNIFNQLFQHLGFSSKMVTGEDQDESSIALLPENATDDDIDDARKKYVASAKKKIVMPKQITTTSEKTNEKAAKVKEEPKASSVSKSTPSTPLPPDTQVKKEPRTLSVSKSSPSTPLPPGITVKKEPQASSVSKSTPSTPLPADSKVKKEPEASSVSKSTPSIPLAPTTTIPQETAINNITFPANDFQQRLLKASLAQRQKQVKQKSTTTIPQETAINNITFPANDFQQRLLKASLAQRQKQVKQKSSMTSSAKYQQSIKHIRVLTELYNNTKEVTTLSSTTKTESTKSKNKKREAQRGKIMERARKVGDEKGRIVSKEDATGQKKAVDLVRTEAKGGNKKDMPLKAKQIVPKEKEGKTETPSKPQISDRKPKSQLRRSSKFQQRLLQARLQCDKKAKDLVSEKLQQEALILEQAKLEESQRKQYAFQRRLLEQKNRYDAEAIERFQMLRVLQDQLMQAKRDREAKNKRDVLFHQSLLAARYKYVRRAKTFKMRRLAEQILQQKEDERKQKEYQFQRRRLASSLESTKRQKEKEKQDKLNRLLQDSKLINYTKQKIGEKSKFKFQRKLLEASIENQRIARRQEKERQLEKQKLKFQEDLMEERLRSEAKADALKRAEQARADLQKELAAAAERRIREKRKSDFQQDLLAAKVRYDLVERKRLAEKRIKQLHESLLNAQRESELAAAQVLEAEERKRQAQLELEQRQKRQEEEERMRQAQLELEERQRREEEEKEKKAQRIAAQQRLEKQIKESKEREAAIRRELESAGRQKGETDSDPSAGGMNEYEAILESQRKQAVQRRIDDGKRRQEELRRILENAGRTKASEQTMNRYEEILQKQKSEEIQRRTEEARRRQENLRRQLEEAGREKAQEGASSMDKYSKWVGQANKNPLSRPDSWQPPNAAAVSGPVIQPPPESVGIERQPLASLQPDQASPASISPEVTEVQPEQQSQLDADPLIGQVLLDKFVIAEKLRVGGDRSELYKCYHVLDTPQQYALVIKLSHNIQQIELEHRIYGDLFSRLSKDRQELFVRAYDWVPASDLTNGRVGFAMECGLENLRGHIWRHGPYTGEKLRTAMENVIRIVQALHGLGVVWSELKAENFIVFEGDKIKAVDLESVAAHSEFLRAYTAETYPPEFPADSLYQCLPQIPVDYSFDVWGMGLTLYELAVGEPLFTLQRTYDVDYIKERLKNPQGIVDEANKKMWKVESGARNIIRKCLVVDPTKRSSCDELLQDPYFTNAKQTRPASFSPSAMGSRSFN